MSTAAKWMEEYWSKIIAGVTLLVLGWVGISLNQLVIAIPLIEERVKVLQIQSANLQNQIASLPATMTKAQVDERVQPIERDVERLRVRIDRVEKDLYVTYPNPNKRVE